MRPNGDRDLIARAYLCKLAYAAVARRTNQRVAGHLACPEWLAVDIKVGVPVELQNTDFWPRRPRLVSEYSRDGPIVLFKATAAHGDGYSHVGVVELDRGLRCSCAELVTRVLKTGVGLCVCVVFNVQEDYIIILN